MNNQQPQLNPGTFTSAIRMTAGLAAALRGTTDTSVLNFTGAATTEGIGLAQTTTAENGTIFTAARPGLYQVQLRGGNGGAVAAVAGVSVNIDAAGLTIAPNFGTTGVRDVTIIEGADAAGNPAPIQQTSLIAVTAADVAAGVAAGAAGAQIRLHATGAGVVQGTASIEIRRVNSLF